MVSIAVRDCVRNRANSWAVRTTAPVLIRSLYILSISVYTFSALYILSRSDTLTWRNAMGILDLMFATFGYRAGTWLYTLLCQLMMNPNLTFR